MKPTLRLGLEHFSIKRGALYRYAIVWAALILFLAACGGGDDGGDEGDSGGSTSSATVTVGDTVYQFTIDLPNQCSYFGTSLAGTFAIDADGNAMQGGDGTRAVALSFHMPVADWESQGGQPPSIGVDDTTRNIRWQAGGLSGSGGVDPGDSEVTSWETGDGWAKGDAIFTNLTAHFAGQDTEPQSGSFDITCGG